LKSLLSLSNKTMLGRRRLLALLGAAACTSPSLASASPQYEEVGWKSLTPPGWDPLKSFKDLDDFASLPDTDPRVKVLNERLRQVLDAAPIIPSMDGRLVRLSGFVVPLESTNKGLREFLLVPYFGACIHSPPPPANQIVHVRLDAPVKGFQTMSTVWISGPLKVARSTSGQGVSGYTMKAVAVEPYVSKKW
jgi:hypothetical protein